MRKLLVAAALAAFALLTAPATGHAGVRVNVANSTLYWVPDHNDPGVVDDGASYGYDCAERLYGTNTYACATEYHLETAQGRALRRRYVVAGEVSWSNVFISVLYPGVYGTPHSEVGYRFSWLRRWHRDPERCLAGERVHGYVVSNMPCGTVASAIAHGNPRLGQILGTGSGYWPWLNEYHCKRRGDWTTCSNKVGDSYRYRGRFPYEIP